MSEITSSIKIEDGFTEPLKNLSKQALYAESALTATAKAVAETVSEFEAMDYAIEAGFAAFKGLDDATKGLQKRAIDYTKNVLIPYAKTHIPYARVMMHDWAEDFVKSTKKMGASSIALKNDLQRNVADTFYRLQNRSINLANKGLDKVTSSKLYNSQFSVRLRTNLKEISSQESLAKSYEAAAKKIKRSVNSIVDSVKHEKAVIEKARRMARIQNKMVDNAKLPEGIIVPAGVEIQKVPKKNMFNYLSDEKFANKNNSLIAKALINGENRINDITNNVKQNVNRDGFINGYNRSKNWIKNNFNKSKIGNIYQNEKKWFQYAQKMSNLSQGHGWQTSTLNILSDEAFAARSGSYLSRGLSTARNAPANLKKMYGNAKFEALALRSTAENKIFDNAAKLKEFSKNLAEKTKAGVSEGMTKAVPATKTFVSSFIKDLRTNLLMMFAEKVAFAVFNKLKDSMINAFQAAREAIAKSLDELNLSDKFSAMFGENGKAAEERSFNLANELGENSTMVGEMSAKAALQGIGTDDFERIMRFSDKIGKLSMGESTENAANTLLQNIKSGHDADSIAQMLGGGDMMARKLRRSGYERALNRGDMNKALDIAEKIAEQAGFTDEKYQKASNSMSQNYKKIENVVDNIKRRLSKIYVEQLEPIVERIKNFLESDTFKTIIEYVERGVRLIGKGVNWVLKSMLDNVHLLGVFLAIGIGAKLFFIWRAVSTIPFALKIINGVLGFFGLNLKTIFKLVKLISWNSFKAALPWILIGGAIVGAVYGLHKFLGVSESIVGFLAGGYKFAMNVFTNIFTWFDNVITKVHAVIKAMQYQAGELIIYLKSNFGTFLAWLIKGISNVVDYTPLGLMLKAAGYDLSDTLSGAVAGQVEKMFNSEATDEEKAEQQKLLDEFTALDNHHVEYIDVMEGVEEAYKLNGDTVKEWLKKIWGLEKEQTEEQKGIGSNTNLIRKMNEQEEELKWLRAFSDRQIMSRISNETSYSRTVNVNGLSEPSRRQLAIMGMNARPSRGSM